MKHFTNQAFGMSRGVTLLASLVLWLTLGLTVGQAQMQVRPGVMDTCYASTEVMNTKVHPEHSMEEMQLLRRSAAARMAAPADGDMVPPTKTAEFIVEYNGFTPEARAAFQYAVDIWSTIVVSDVPIRVEANFLALAPGVLGSAGTTNLFANFEGAPEEDRWYYSALADALSGQDLNQDVDTLADFPDIRTRFSSVFNWYYGTDLNPASDQYDFVTIVLHELGHGLGFSGFAGYEDSTQVGDIRFNYRGLNLPVIYNDFVKDGFRTPILAVPDPSVKLGALLTGRNNLFMTGKNTVAAYDGEQPQLFAPDVWNPGSSYSHWDEESFPPGDSNSLMTPFAGFAESNHQVGAITKGLFEDMGWTINEDPVALISLRQTVKVSPEEGCDGSVPLTDDIAVLPGSQVCFYYTVTNTGDLPLTLHSLKDTQSGNILVDVEQNLPPGASLTVSRQERIKNSELPLTNVATWTASTPGEVGEVTATAITNLTFAPIAKVEPMRKVGVNIKMGERKIRPLRIINQGQSVLTYTAVIREADTTFSARVAASQKAVAESNSLATGNLMAMSSQDAISGFGRTPYNGEALKAVQFATDFESFVVGPLGSQNGWATDDTLAQISEASPFSGTKHLRLLSDSTKVGQYRVLSPLIRNGAEPFSSFSVKLKLTDEGAQYRIFPSREVNGELSIEAGIRIEPNKEVFVFVAGQGYVSTEYILPDQYVELKYVASRFEEVYDLYVDDQLIAEDVSVDESDVDLVEFRYYGGATGVALDIDDIELIDGDAAAPDWVQVDPASDSIPARTRLNADIVFDARGLEPGVYTADITILTNDPFNPSAVVPVEMTVVGKPTGLEPLDLVAVCSDSEDQLQWKVANANNSEMEVNWSVVGTSQRGSMRVASGEAFFYTDPTGGNQRVAIEWQNGDQTVRRVATADAATCASVATRMEVYPVPSLVGETLTVGLTGDANTAGTLSIHDQISGKVVFEKALPMTGAQQLIELSTVEVGMKSAGVYIVSFEAEGTVETKRVVVE